MKLEVIVHPPWSNQCFVLHFLVVGCHEQETPSACSRTIQGIQQTRKGDLWNLHGITVIDIVLLLGIRATQFGQHACRNDCTCVVANYAALCRNSSCKLQLGFVSCDVVPSVCPKRTLTVRSMGADILSPIVSAYWQLPRRPLPPRWHKDGRKLLCKDGAEMRVIGWTHSHTKVM